MYICIYMHINKYTYMYIYLYMYIYIHIYRPKLLPAEWIAVAIVSTLYFITAIIAQVSEIVLVHDIHGDSPESVLIYQIPESFMDVS
jgi:hypothetical protein